MFNLAETYREFIENETNLAGTPQMSLDQLVEVLAIDPEMIVDDETWQAALDLHGDSRSDQDQLVDLVTSGLGAAQNSLREAVAAVDTDRFISLRETVEKYAFLGHWLLCRAESEISSDKQDADTAADTLGRRPKSAGVPGSRCCALLTAFSRVVSVGLEALLPTRTERDTFASLYLRPSLRIIEHEVICKDAELRRHVLKAVCVGVKRQGQLPMVETQAIQLLCYYEHVADVLVELIVVLKEQYDHSALADAVLRTLSTKQWSAQDSRGPKNVATFISRLASSAPAILVSQLDALIPLGDDTTQSLRSATLDVLGKAVLYLLAVPQTDESDQAPDRTSQAAELVDLICLRVNDASHYVRSRAVQNLTAIVTSQARINSLRPKIGECAASKCKDRSQLVRRSGFRLMTALIETHPFRAGDGRLVADEWASNLKKLEDELVNVLEETTEEIVNTSLDQPEPEVPQLKTETVTEQPETGRDESFVEHASQVASALQLQVRYHQDAVKFIEQVESCVDTASALLGSQSKADLVDAMDFFFLCRMYGVKAADAGIRASVHLVWVKATNDDKEAVQDKVLQIYSNLFLRPPESAGPRDSMLYVAGNLIDLAVESDTSGLASLEQLLVLALARGLIAPSVLTLLWQIYSSDQPSVTPRRRRGAAMVLGMFAKEDPNVAKSGVDHLLSIGLGELARDDIELARYSCIILERIQSPAEWTKSVPPARLPLEHEIFQKLGQLLLIPNPDTRWFAFAQIALRVMNNLCEEAAALCSELLKAYAQSGAAADAETEQQLFCQEIFIAGEVALNLAIDLDRNELIFKRRFRESAAEKQAAPDAEGDDLQMVGGTTEDDFTEAVREIRERELLFSDRALLASYARLVVDLCNAELEMPHQERLGISLTLTLSKFMLVSSVFAEQNLPLLMQLAEKSPRQVIRANIVVALGDLAMCFNPLIDKHTEFLYARLTDPDDEVQRTAMVTLTNLILKGQIKVKGQIVEMATALESSDPHISRLAHLFFSEYSTKENAIYNSFLDILSGLSAALDLPEPDAQRILKFIVGFIEKERQIKQLEDRLLQRLPRCQTQRQWNLAQYVLINLKGERSDAVKAKLEAGFTSVERVEEVPPTTADAEQGALPAIDDAMDIDEGGERGVEIDVESP